MGKIWLCVLIAVCSATAVRAQDLTVASVTRPPFSMVENGADTGFSIDLLAALMEDMDRSYVVVRADSFSEMLNMVQTGQADLAAANVSITAGREHVMDFSQPIFSSGLQIMTHMDGTGRSSLLRAILSRDMLLAVVVAFALLIGAGMLMWRFERGRQPYFDQPAREAAFPAFWWALNLVVNGGFEERAPRSAAGRVFGVLLVISSLFFVSVFVARITAIMTVDAIQSSVNSINDLDGRRIGTIDGSTAGDYLQARDLHPVLFADLDTLLRGFEERELDAVVFDAPILSYYITTTPEAKAELVGPIFLPENYGIALPSGSPLAEPLNQSLLSLRENGTYNSIYRKWFGRNPGAG